MTIIGNIGTNGRKYLLTATMIFAGLAIAAVGCHTAVSAAEQYPGQTQAQGAYPDQGPDPADANMAPIDGNYSQQPYQQQPSYQGGAPIVRQQPSGSQSYNQNYDPNSYDPNSYDPNSYDPNADQDQGQPLLEADQPPPDLPTYDQPEAPEPDYLWTPGYWSWGPGGYYWVPGVWCAAPYQGALWTPGYWYFYGNHYRFHRGFWGLYIGFYGGVNYGYGYFGTGYQGGYWNGPHFYYNRAVTRINVTRVSYVYNRTVVVNNITRVSYNGGRGGISIRPRPAEIVAMRQTRIPPMTAQIRVQRDAAQNRAQFFNQNRGRPAIAAAPRPIVADRGIQRPTPVRVTRPIGQPGGGQNGGGQPGGQGGFRPGQGRPDQGRPDQGQGRPDQGQGRPDFGRPNQPNQPNQVRPDREQGRPDFGRPNQPNQPNQPQVQPQPGVRPAPGDPRINNQNPNPNVPRREFRPDQQTPAPTPQPQPQQPQPQPQPQPQQPQPGARPAPGNPRFNQNQQPDVPRREFRPDQQVQRPTPQPQPQPQVQQPQQPRPQQPEMRQRPQESRPAPQQARPAAPAAQPAPPRPASNARPAEGERR